MPSLADLRPLIDALVAFDTTSARSNLALIAYIERHLAAHGIPAQVLPNPEGTKASLYATIGPPRDGGILLSGHTDVVPVAGQAWSSDPFRLAERQGRLHGRGTADMKGFLAAALALAGALARAPLVRPLHLAFSFDEEVGCTGAPPLIAHVAAASPRPCLAIIGEPSEMRLVTASKGILGFRTRIVGAEAHSSQPGLGLNAIMVAAELIGHLAALEREMAARGDATGRFSPPSTTLNIGTIAGGTAINIVAREAEFTWECRPLPGTDENEIIDRFERFAREELLPRLHIRLPSARIDTERLHRVPPLSDQGAKSAEALVKRLLGTNESFAVSFAAEAGLWAEAGIPSVICGPGSIAEAHKADEFVTLDQLEACLAFMRRIGDHLMAE